MDLDLTATSAQLEKKLDDLVGLLGDRARHRLDTPLPSISSSSHSPGDPLPQDETYPGANTHDPVPAGPTSSSAGAPAALPSHRFDPSVPGENPELAVCAEQLTPEEADENLAAFRNHNAFSCPFLYIAPGKTSRQLRSESPFLWFNLMAVTTKSLAQQRRMNQAIRRHLAQAMVIEDQKSMDLLWGLLVFMSW